MEVYGLKDYPQCICMAVHRVGYSPSPFHYILLIQQLELSRAHTLACTLHVQLRAAGAALYIEILLYAFVDDLYLHMLG